MATITYDNKSTLNPQPSVANVNKVTSEDMNEIKQVVNTNYEEVGDITSLTTTDKTSVVSAINELKNAEIYSTSEVKTNKVWINGKPIYRKVIIGTTTIASGNYTVAHDISNLGDIVDFKFYSWQNSTTIFIGSTSPLDDSNKLSVYINGNNIAVRNSWESIKRVIILEYTKTTD